MGITSVAELKGRNVRELTVCVGASSAEALLLLARGKDGSPVVQSGPPKSITCEDSFKTCSTFKGVESVVRLSKDISNEPCCAGQCSQFKRGALRRYSFACILRELSSRTRTIVQISGSSYADMAYQFQKA
jgi:hypothetical protein